MNIERFEDLEAWQEARKLANIVYDLVSRNSFRRDFRLRDLIRRIDGQTEKTD